MTKAYAEMAYHQDPLWQEAHYNYEIADCEAEYSKYLDPKWQKAHQDYRYYKDFGLDKDWNPKWIKVKMDYDKIDDEVENAKKMEMPCAKYDSMMKAAEAA